MKKQADGLSREFDRVSDELVKLQVCFNGSVIMLSIWSSKRKLFFRDFPRLPLIHVCYRAAVTERTRRTTKRFIDD